MVHPIMSSTPIVTRDPVTGSSLDEAVDPPPPDIDDMIPAAMMMEIFPGK